MCADPVPRPGEGLTAATLLGRNTTDVLAALVDHLASRTGLALRFDADHALRDSEDRDAWRRDLIWACGLLSMRVLESGGTGASIVAAPVFAGQEDARYHSVVVARADGDVGSTARVARARLAVNEFASWSGCHALLAHLAARGHSPRFAAVVASGSHRASVEAVGDDRADVAAVDHTVWDHLRRTEPPLTDGLVVVERTRSWPAPPFLLAGTLDPGTRARLLDALVAVGPGDVDGLERVEPCGADAYRVLLDEATARESVVEALRRRASRTPDRLEAGRRIP